MIIGVGIRENLENSRKLFLLSPSPYSLLIHCQSLTTQRTHFYLLLLVKRAGNETTTFQNSALKHLRMLTPFSVINLLPDGLLEIISERIFDPYLTVSSLEDIIYTKWSPDKIFWKISPHLKSNENCCHPIYPISVVIRRVQNI